MLEEILQIFDINTDAIVTNRGFYYQYLSVLKKWINNFIENNDIKTYTEVDDDIKEVGDNLVFTQIKCYSSTFSLNSRDIKKSIFNFFLLYLKNKELNKDIIFCFSTNTQISSREKLLKSWIDDSKFLDEDLKLSCINKVKEILIDEIKLKKNKKLNSKISNEKKQEIKLLSESFKTLVLESDIEKFTKSIVWKFENISTEEAIEKSTNEIDFLLKNQKFNGISTSILFSVFISEIYKYSQNKNSEERYLTNKTIEDILINTDLEILINNKISKLLKIDVDLLKIEVIKIQEQIEKHDFKIDNLEQIVKSKFDRVIPKELTILPDYNSNIIYDWEDFLKEVKSKLNEKKILSIYSEGGMGKTSFARKYLKSFIEYKHIIWITVENSIAHSFVFDELLVKNIGLEFSKSDNVDQRFKILLGELNKIDGQNLLVLDIQELENDISSFNLLKSLSSFEKLILTRNHLTSIPSIKLPRIKIENAIQIFNSNCSKLSDDILITEFINYTDFNLLFLELTAKTIENSVDLTLDLFFKLLKEQKLDDNELNIDIDLNDNNETIRIFNFLLKKFNFENLDSYQKHYLEFIALLPSRNIVIEDIILINGIDFYDENKIVIGNAINSFAKKGLVEYSLDKKSINIHKIFKEIIIYNSRNQLNPFVGISIYITWLTFRIQEGNNNPSKSFKFLKYAQSILDSIKEDFRQSIYQPLIMLENELLFSYRFYINSKDELQKWIDLSQRSEKHPFIDEINHAVIYTNLGVEYSSNNDNDNSLLYFKKAEDLFKRDEKKYISGIITCLNNTSNIYLKNRDLRGALENFKEVQKIRKKYNLYNDQQIVIEYKILADTYKICNEFKKAIQIMNEGIKKHLSLVQENRNDFYLGICFNLLSTLHILDNDFDLAILNQEIAVKILEEMKLYNSEYLFLMYQILLSLYNHKEFTAKANEVE
ncbi:hypothetical protein, partial [Flavobacterium sp.]|uniref:hypothetical protein n=1 Tax=Flavobacterium sp. TaxID=239 RepID=UPI00286BE442